MHRRLSTPMGWDTQPDTLMDDTAALLPSLPASLSAASRPQACPIRSRPPHPRTGVDLSDGGKGRGEYDAPVGREPGAVESMPV